MIDLIIALKYMPCPFFKEMIPCQAVSLQNTSSLLHVSCLSLFTGAYSRLEQANLPNLDQKKLQDYS